MNFTYKGLEAQLTKHVVTEEEVNRQIHRLLQQNPRVTSVTDRPTQKGDEVVLDYTGYMDGKEFAGGTAQKQTLVLGSGAFIPGFEEQLEDKVPGEKVVVKVCFPDDYHAEELAGKMAEFHCVIHEILIKKPYELDDIFAKEVGECESLEEMRSKMQESIQAYTDEQGELDLQDRLLRQAAATLDFSIEEKELEAAVDAQMKVLEGRLAQQGLNLEMYCSFMQTTPEALRQDAYPDAEVELRNKATVDKIAELENIQVSEEEIGKALALIARQNHLTMEQLKNCYDSDFEEAVIRSITTTKVMQLIRDAAKITEN